MNWEDLSVYRPLIKEDLKAAKKDLTNLVANEFVDDGFVLRERKLYRLSNDILQVIHIDTRGTWMGASEYFKVYISICSVYDIDSLVKGYDDLTNIGIDKLMPEIRDHERITQEYPLLADYLNRKIRESVLPYLFQFKSSNDVLNHFDKIKLNRDSNDLKWNDNLILFSELANKNIVRSTEILDKKLTWLKQSDLNDIAIQETELLSKLVNERNWDEIETLLIERKQMVFKKLKLK